MAYQREPMTCRCKRYVWKDDDPKLARWLDTNTQYRYSDLTCPDCKTKCGKNGAISYTDGRMVMVSLPYDNRDFYSRLTTMTMKLPDGCVVLDAQRGLVSIDIKPHKYDGWKASDAMKDMLNTCITQKETSVKMLSVEECKQKLNEAVKNKVIRKWKTFSNCRSDLWHPYGIEITYTDGATRSFTGGTNASAHYQAVDLVTFITPKEKKMSLKEAVQELRDVFDKHNGRHVITFFGKETGTLNTVVKYMANCCIGQMAWTEVVCRHPSCDDADYYRSCMVVEVSGELRDITLRITKNRFGKCYTLKANAFDNTSPKEKRVNRYSYDECFRIMRKAKKDGIIRGWGFCSNNSNVEQQPATWVERDGLVGTKRFTDDGTKGDIGVLNEVVAYVNRLSKEHALKNAKPDTKDMTEKQLMEEIRNRGYHTGHTTHEKILPTFGLYTQNTSTGTSRPTGISWQSGETRHDFLAKCVDHIRKQK